MKLVTAVFVVVAVVQNSQPSSAQIWKPFEFLVGSWKGDESATFGQGTGERRYRFILQDRYLISENASRFPARADRPAEAHDDWTIFSYDTARRTYVIRQFNSEGFVNTLVMDPASEVPRKMRFVAETTENAPEGTRVVLEFEVLGEDEFVERFEVRFPGSAAPMAIGNRWRRTSR
jgi:hypothetical protein